LEIINREKSRIVIIVKTYLSGNSAGQQPADDFLENLRFLFTRELIDAEGFNRLFAFFHNGLLEYADYRGTV